MIYEFHPEAEQEFVEAAAYYERNVTDLGERFGSRVRFYFFVSDVVDATNGGKDESGYKI